MKAVTTFHVTFGQKYDGVQMHPFYEAAHRDAWIDVQARNEREARGLTVDLLSTAWAFIYADDDPDWRPDLHPLGCKGLIVEGDDGLACWTLGAGR